MKKNNFYVIALIAISSILNASITHENQNLKPAAINIFSLFDKSIVALKDANIYAQKNFLRKGERWDEQENNLILSKNQKFIIENLKSLGLIDSIFPIQKSFTYAIVLGGLNEHVFMRLLFLDHLIQNNYNFEQIILLCSDRLLIESERKQLPENITDESQMILYHFEHNKNLKNQKMLLVKEEGHQNNKTTTESTLRVFKKTVSGPGSCLITSNNPFIMRQAKNAKKILGKEFEPIIGGGFKCPTILLNNLPILMDEFARLIYVESLEAF